MPMSVFVTSLWIALGAAPYGWEPSSEETLAMRFPPPEGFIRMPVEADGFGAWLRGLPLLPEGTDVLLYSGAPKANQAVHAAVIDLDIGEKDLQQCADAVMRLRAEWLYGSGRKLEVRFNDTGKGAPIPFDRWAKGERPRAKGSVLLWTKSAPADESRASFRKYLDSVFMWAGTASLEKQLKKKPVAEVAPGDVLIKGGFPGHAVLVLDVARHPKTSELRLLLGQSYMPAQNFHVLKMKTGEAWFSAPTPAEPYETPEWTFPANSLRTW